jgi:CheY-specific phosphatase CheX
LSEKGGGDPMKIEENVVRELSMTSVFDVFEKMYFTFLEPREDEPSDDKCFAVQIGFTGGLDGEMYAFYSEELAQSMVGNALGLDEEEITDQVLQDCLKECINMVCGNFLQKIEPNRVLQLSIPRFLGKAAVPKVGGWPSALCLPFESDGMALDIVLRFSKIEA